MQKITFALLMLISSIAHGEWIAVGEVKNGISNYYGNKGIERKEEQGAIIEGRAWIVTNYEHEQTDIEKSTNYKSMVSRITMDCKNKSTAIETKMLYSEKDGTGQLVSHSDFTELTWEAIKPRTNNDALRMVLCGNSNK